MNRPTVIVIGASAGGVSALKRLVAALPERLAASVLIVLHVGAHRSELPGVLGAAGPLPAKHAETGEKIMAGRIYVAPPDRHMIVVDGHLQLTRGPRENWTRPAINPLFRTAARYYGSDLIGIILTGRLNDGAAGLLEVKRRGGTTVVQTPDDADYPAMPISALAHVDPDYCLPLAEMPALIGQLVAEGRRTNLIPATLQTVEAGRAMTTGHDYERPIAITCPDCGGALRPEEGGTLVEYRCHIQHVYTAEVLAEAQFDQMERVMRAGERIVHERSEFCRQMAVRAATSGATDEERSWRAAERQALDRAYELRDLIEQDWIRPGTDPLPAPALAGGEAATTRALYET